MSSATRVGMSAARAERLRALREHEVQAVVIGGSAGAVDALAALLPELPPGFPAAVAIVVHLPADKPSLLRDIFDGRCALPVCEAEDKAPITPGTICFAPPAYHLFAEANRVYSLSVEPPIHFSRPSIDALFESAAFAYGEHLLGIVLTGANMDGASGLAEIHGRGGLTWVQDPSTASSSAMPLAAREAVPGSEILSVEEMAETLAAWSKTSSGRGG